MRGRILMKVRLITIFNCPVIGEYFLVCLYFILNSPQSLQTIGQGQSDVEFYGESYGACHVTVPKICEQSLGKVANNLCWTDLSQCTDCKLLKLFQR